jgi:hypothetical protein
MPCLAELNVCLVGSARTLLRYLEGMWVAYHTGCSPRNVVRFLDFYKINYTYLTHSWSWALLEKLPIVQLLKNFPAFYGTRRFITVFTRALHRSLSWARWIQSIPSHLSKIHFNIVHPPTSWSSQWSLSFWLSHHYPLCIPLLPHSCYMPQLYIS